MIDVHANNDQFNFKERDKIEVDNYVLYRDNRFSKGVINNRHDMTMSKHNNAGYGYQVFEKSTGHNVATIWFLNQVNSKTTYIRVSRYGSTKRGHFIAVLTELNDFFNSYGYTFILKTQIDYAKRILSMNFVAKKSSKAIGKRGKNDRSKKNVSVDGLSFDLSEKTDTYQKYQDIGSVDA